MYPTSSGVVSERTLMARHALDAACDELLNVGSQHALYDEVRPFQWLLGFWLNVS